MPSTLELSLIVLFAVLFPLAETFIAFPRFKAAVAAGQPDARRHAYRNIVCAEWWFVALAVILWVRSGRPWTGLGLIPPTDVRLVASVVIVGLILAIGAQQLRGVRRITAHNRATVRPRLAAVEFFLPHSAREYRWFVALSVTAGVGEELLYRGLLTWALLGYIGLPGAVAVSALVFGLNHAYLGARGVANAAATGLVMSLVVIASGWLLPAMILHVLLDVSAGAVGFRVLGEHGTVATAT